MRAVLLCLAILVAGCASPDPSADATPGGTSPPAGTVTTPAAATTVVTASPAATTPPAPTSSPEVFLGVVLEETHDFATDGRKTSFFNVTGGESKVVIDIASAGPPADRSFQSAVVDFYFPGTTSPFLNELPGSETRSYTVEQQPHRGMWRVVYDGVGKTSVHIRVTLQ